MTKAMRRRFRAGALVLGLSVLAAFALWQRPASLQSWQEIVFDTIIRLSPAPDPAIGPHVLVVDIGARDDAGVPWDRTASARLAAALAKGGAAVVAWDIVFSGSCDDATPNLALAVGLSRAPSVLGFLLTGSEGPAPRPAPSLAISDDALPALWPAPGAEAPCAGFASAAAGLGSVSLPGDDRARVRMVPAAVSVGGIAYPSLTVEALRLARSLPTPLIGADGGNLLLRLGETTFPLDAAATLRFRPSPERTRAARTVAADAVLADGGLDRLQGAVIFVGSSLPQRGGLRPTAEDPLYPSVQIAADLAEGLLNGRLPWRPVQAAAVEAGVVLAAGALAALLVVIWPPLPALGGAAALAAVWAAAAIAAHATTGRLLDPLFPALSLVLAATLGLIVQAATTARAERALRGRMGQLLPGPVVARLIDDPNLLRLRGERREVTALFTDLEGFSTLTNTTDPEALIATLDRYFTCVSAIILRHGGMIDKIVGDAVHALFNAPLDQPGHVDAALAAAAEIVAETEALRVPLTLGRTRVGVETGPAILGDVGSGARIDYTAHGPSVNLAARLQEAGKTLGPAVIIGPAAAAKASRPLRPLGEAEVRSFGRLTLHTLA